MLFLTEIVSLYILRHDPLTLIMTEIVMTSVKLNTDEHGPLKKPSANRVHLCYTISKISFRTSSERSETGITIRV